MGIASANINGVLTKFDSAEIISMLVTIICLDS
jgi:hypothetical protein